MSVARRGANGASVLSLGEMTWQEVDGLDRETTVITFACGPVEQHGPQTPLGTDPYVAERVMNECAWARAATRS